MHPQLELLLEMQDLRSQKRALAEGDAREFESEMFEVQIEEALGKIDEKLGELEDRLEGEAARRYGRIRGKHRRTVVPVVDGTCYGCFMAVPTSWASDADRNVEIESCENCGRFLYHLG